MEEALISFGTAKLAKEKGFDISIDSQPYTDTTNPCCKDCINKREVDYYPNDYDCIMCSTDDPDRWVSKNKVGQCDDFVRELFQRPTQSLLQKWLRESHKINVIPTMSRFSRTYGYKIYYIEDGKTEVIDCQYIKNNSFEEAFEAGLQNGLELIEIKP